MALRQLSEFFGVPAASFGYEEVDLAPKVKASLELATKQVVQLEREASELGAAAAYIVELLDLAEATVRDAKARLRVVLEKRKGA